jgi:lysylphosphatidylglycerol synthetase-like protein (DUF2156 family)
VRPALLNLDERWPLGPLVRALLTFVALADIILSLELWLLRHKEDQWAVRAVLDTVAPFRVLAALAVAGAALYLATRPKRAFRRVLVLLAALAMLASLRSRMPVLIAIAVADGLVAMMAGSLWPEEGHPAVGRLGWSLLCVSAGSGVLSVLLFLGQRHAHHPKPGFVLPLLLAFGSAVIALALLDRNPRVPGRWDLAAALGVYATGGRSGVSPFALMRDKRHFWSEDLSSFVAFGCRTGVALALGPALGLPAEANRLQNAFRAACRLRGWRPAFYQVSEATAGELAKTRRLRIGSEAMVDVERFSLQGRAMANLRHMVTKARRLGLRPEVQAEVDVPWETRVAMRFLAQDVAGRRAVGEMSFSVGTPGQPEGVERTFGLAFGEGGTLVAYVTWLWLPARRTMVLDEVKRRPQAPAGAVELLIATSLEQFKGRAERASLGLAPIAGAGEARWLASVERLVRNVLHLRGAGAGLYAFKAKFSPVWEPRWLVVERFADLPAVLMAMLLLHYPTLWGWKPRTAGARRPSP